MHCLTLIDQSPQKLEQEAKARSSGHQAMWMKKGEAMDPDVHTFNRYSFVAHSGTNYSAGEMLPNHLPQHIWFSHSFPLL